MEIITLPRLKNAELQSITETSLKICAPIKEIEEQKKQVEKEFAAFKEGAQKNKTKAEKKIIDDNRDDLISGLFFNIKSETYYPYTDKAANETIVQLKELSKKYGTKINRLPYNEETAAIDNCIEEVEKIDLSTLESPSITRWIPMLKDANQRFKEVTKEFVEDSTAATKLASATSSAPNLIHAVEELFIQLFALIRVSPTDELKKTYSELQTLVDSYR